MTPLLHAFVSGLGAGIAFALCQALTMWLAQRRANRVVAEAQARMQAQMRGFTESWEQARIAADRRSGYTRGGDAN